MEEEEEELGSMGGWKVTGFESGMKGGGKQHGRDDVTTSQMCHGYSLNQPRCLPHIFKPYPRQNLPLACTPRQYSPLTF